MHPEVVVVGDVVTDVVTRLRQPIALGSDAAADIWTGGGGSGANVAAWLGHSGVPVAFVGRVGDDDAGRLRIAELRSLGVQPNIAVDAGAATGTVVVVVTPGGERTMFPDRGANLALVAGDIDGNLLRRARHLHLSGYTLFDERPREAALSAMAQAREYGLTISVDPSSAEPLRAVGAGAFLEWTAGADVCLPNVAEALVLADTTDAAGALRRLTETYRETVITLGADGAIWSDGSEVAHAPARPVMVEDTTGAGDAFTAGYLAAYLAGAAPQQRLEDGVALAERAVTGRGARP